jgi:hypothetical protein
MDVMPKSTPQSPSSPPTAELKTAMDHVIRELCLYYQPPNTVEGGDATKAWITGFVETVIQESNNPAEILSAWVQFKRTYDRSFWPDPGKFCKAIREYRAEANQYRHYTGPVLAPTDYHKPELVSQATRNATLRALAEADVMAHDADPGKRALGKQLVALGLAIIERNGPPGPA